MTRNIHGMAHDLRIAIAAPLLLALAALPGCKPMKPRPAAAPPAQPAAPAPADAQAQGEADPLDSKYQSKSTLGKARDAALRTRDRMDAYQQDVAKQADDVFKNP
jgi:hypothetical protein